MQYELSNDHNDIVQYIVQNIKEGRNEGIINTNLKNISDKEFLQIKRDIKQIRLCRVVPSMTIQKLELEHIHISRDSIYYANHQWDCIGILLSFGILLPILLPGIIIDTCKWYMSKDCYYVKYDIYATLNVCLINE